MKTRLLLTAVLAMTASSLAAQVQSGPFYEDVTPDPSNTTTTAQGINEIVPPLPITATCSQITVYVDPYNNQYSENQ
jgi:hypothetical protein